MKQPKFIPQSTPLWAADDLQIYLVVAWMPYKYDGNKDMSLVPMGVCDGWYEPTTLYEADNVRLFIDRERAEEYVDNATERRAVVK